MARALLFPIAAPLLSSFSSPSHPSNAWREHWCRCPICKTMCAVELVVLVYINHHTACHCGGKGEAKMGGEDCCCQCRDDPNPPWGCGGNGLKGVTRRAASRALPPPHIDGSYDGGDGFGGALYLLLSSLVAAAVRG